MSIQLVSSHSVIGKFIRDFDPQNLTFEIDAITWIAEALDIMKLAPASIQKLAKITIDNHKTKIPCDVDEILGIRVCEINDKPLNGLRMDEYNGQMPIEKVSDIIPNEYYTFYQVKGNFIHFKFEKGKADIYYIGIPVDDCGYPLVPDDTEVTNAITWYILMKWLARGNKHQVFTYVDAEARWTKTYPSAQNSVKMPTPQRMAKVLRNWTQLIPRINRHEDYFTEQQYHSNPDSFNFDISGFTAPAINP